MGNNIEHRLARLTENVDINHPWVTQHRVPPVSDIHPSMSFIAALVEGSKEPVQYGFDYIEPTAEEVALVGSYINFYKDFFYNESYKRELLDLPVDLDGGANTITFGHIKENFRTGQPCWIYNRITWTRQSFAPLADAPQQFSTLLELIDNIHNRENEPNNKWAQWKIAEGIS